MTPIYRPSTFARYGDMGIAVMIVEFSAPASLASIAKHKWLSKNSRPTTKTVIRRRLLACCPKSLSIALKDHQPLSGQLHVCLLVGQSTPSNKISVGAMPNDRFGRAKHKDPMGKIVIPKTGYQMTERHEDKVRPEQAAVHIKMKLFSGRLSTAPCGQCTPVNPVCCAGTIQPGKYGSERVPNEHMA